MSHPVECQRIEVTRFRGIEHPGFELDSLASGVNVIYGPNASGKSTLAVALKRLLWPDACLEGSEILGGQFQWNGREWEVSVDGGRIDRQGDPPAEMPGEERWPRYHLSLHELLGATNQRFAEQIRQDALGGYDVREAADDLGYSKTTPRKDSLTKAVESARRQWREAIQERDALRERELRLDALRAELEACERAARREEALDSFLSIDEVASELADRRRELERYDERQSRVDGSEFDELCDLEQQLESVVGQLETAQRRTESSRQQLESIRLPADGIAERALEEAEAYLEKLEAFERRLSRLKEEAAAARHEMQRIERRAGSIVDADRAEQANIGDGEVLESLLEKVAQKNAKEQARDVFEEQFRQEDPPEAEQVGRHRDAIRELRRWLRAHARREPSDSETTDRPLASWLLAAAACGAAVGGVLLAILVHWLGVLLVALGVICVAWWFAFEGSGREESSRERDEVIAERFEREFDLDAPSSWNESAVEHRLEEIQTKVAKFEVEREFDRVWRARKSSLTLRESELEAIESLRTRARRALGVGLEEAGLGDVSMHRAVEQLERYQRVADEYHSLENSRQEVVDQRNQKLRRLNDMIERWGEEPVETRERAESVVQSVRNREERRREFESKLEEAQAESESLRSECAELERSIDELYASVDVEADDRAALQALCDAHDDWKQDYETVETLEERLDWEIDRAKSADWWEELEFDDLPEPPWEADRSVLKARRDEAANQKERSDDLRNRIQKTEIAIDEARQSNDVERAAARYREKRDELARRRRRDYGARVGYELADFVHERTRDRDLPEVFHRARHLFSDVTRGRYRLELETGDPPMFRAYDTIAQRRQPLDRLSSGTRLQLLLTVRMAFTERGEGGVALPMVFDETLANSDDLRAQSLIDAIGEVARRGRQVYYLTAQRDEVAQWRASVQTDETFEFEVHRLPSPGEASEHDRRGSHDLRDDLEPVQFDFGDEIPKPEGESHDEYGDRLEVEPWHPRDPLGSVHLWYLIDEIQILYDLLTNGVRTWGQLNTLGAAGSTNLVPMQPSTFQTVRARAQVVEAFAAAWRRGRGKPVDREVLKNSGAVSDNFVDEVSELCDRCRGDAEEIIARLEDGEVKRFRSSKIRELQEYFEQNGYLVSEEPLTDDELQTAVLAEVTADIREDELDTEEIRELISRVIDRHG